MEKTYPLTHQNFWDKVSDVRPILRPGMPGKFPDVEVTMAEYLARCAKLQAIMLTEGVDAFLVAPSADMRYLSGCPLHASERLALVVLPRKGEPVFIVPSLEAPNVASLEGSFDIRPWAEPQDPIAIIREVTGNGQELTLAVSDQLWASYLIQLEAAFPGTRFVTGSQLLRNLRIVKEPDEMEALATVSAMGDRAFERLLSLDIEGMSERQLEARLGNLMMDEGFESLDFRIVGSGENGASPHHFAGDRRISRGDPIVLDFGGTHRGYFSDMTRTICIGDPSEEFRRVYEIVREAQERGIAAARTGIPASEVDAAARSLIEQAGYGEYFIHRTGHGIGLDVHEDPPVGKSSTAVLDQGMVFTVEPGIYLPGKFGVRIEDVVALTGAGAKRLSKSPRELICL